MQRQYTLADLRKLGCETVGRFAILGKGRSRRQFRAETSGVVFDFDRMGPDEQLKTGSLIAALEKKAGRKPAGSEPVQPDAPDAPKRTTKKTAAKPKTDGTPPSAGDD